MTGWNRYPGSEEMSETMAADGATALNASAPNTAVGDGGVSGADGHSAQSCTAAPPWLTTRRRPGRRFPKGRRVDPKALRKFRACRDRPRRRDLLIQHLHLVQDAHGHLSARHLAALAAEVRLAMAEVWRSPRSTPTSMWCARMRPHRQR